MERKSSTDSWTPRICDRILANSSFMKTCLRSSEWRNFEESVKEEEEERTVERGGGEEEAEEEEQEEEEEEEEEE